MLTQTQPEKLAPAVSLDAEGHARPLWVDQAIYLLFIIIALAIPFSTKLAVNAFRVAVALWLVKLLVYRPKIRFEPLFLAMLLFLVLTAAASSLSPEPALSWGRMRTVSLLLLVPLIMQTLTSLRQARTLVMALIFSTMIAVTYTGWQYIFGIGVSLEQIKPGSPLAHAALLPNDVITHINGKRIYAPSTLRDIVDQGPLGEALKITMQRNAPPETHNLQFERRALQESGLTAPDALGRGHPVRAQGFFKHYIPFSELLMLTAGLTFGLALCARKMRTRSLFALVFLAIGAALIATMTRATLAALLMACVAVYWIKVRWRQRLASLIMIIIFSVVSSIWFQHSRGLGWFQRDAGSNYRVLMWKDGARLIRQHPWFGVGMDSIYRHWQEWDIKAYQRYPHLKSHFHSAYVQIAVEAGLPALVTWVWILASLGLSLLRYARTAPSEPEIASGVVVGALIVALALAINSFVHYSSGDAEFMIAFWLLMGIGISTGKTLTTQIRPAHPQLE
jgi:hypothetical protein